MLVLAVSKWELPHSFRILITGDTSGLVETITDAISVHSIKKGEYARRLAEGDLKHVSLLDHYVRVGPKAMVLGLRCLVVPSDIRRDGHWPFCTGTAKFYKIARW